MKQQPQNKQANVTTACCGWYSSRAPPKSLAPQFIRDTKGPENLEQNRYSNQMPSEDNFVRETVLANGSGNKNMYTVESIMVKPMIWQDSEYKQGSSTTNATKLTDNSENLATKTSTDRGGSRSSMVDFTNVDIVSRESPGRRGKREPMPTRVHSQHMGVVEHIPPSPVFGGRGITATDTTQNQTSDIKFRLREISKEKQRGPLLKLQSVPPEIELEECDVPDDYLLSDRTMIHRHSSIHMPLAKKLVNFDGTPGHTQNNTIHEGLAVSTPGFKRIEQKWGSDSPVRRFNDSPTPLNRGFSPVLASVSEERQYYADPGSPEWWQAQIRDNNNGDDYINESIPTMNSPMNYNIKMLSMASNSLEYSIHDELNAQSQRKIDILLREAKERPEVFKEDVQQLQKIPAYEVKYCTKNHTHHHHHCLGEYVELKDRPISNHETQLVMNNIIENDHQQADSDIDHLLERIHKHEIPSTIISPVVQRTRLLY